MILSRISSSRTEQRVKEFRSESLVRLGGTGRVRGSMGGFLAFIIVGGMVFLLIYKLIYLTV